MARYRLHTACHIDGAFHEAGAVIEKPDDWVGPHRAVVSAHETLTAGAVTHGRNEALYTKLSDEAEAPAIKVGHLPSVADKAKAPDPT